MSSPVVRERQYIVSCAYQELEANPELLGELPCNPPDMVPIVFEFLKTVRSGLIDEEDDEEPPSLRLEDTCILQVEVIRDVVGLRPPPPPPPPPSSPVYFGAFLGLLDLYTEYLSMITDNEEEGLEIVGPDSLEAKKQESCPICMDDFEEKEDAAPIARLLSCFHVFHRHCILRWLHRIPLCPLCRCPSLHKKRKLEEMLSSSTPIGPPSNIPRLT
ncbi:hypothetical protein ACLB2K_053250 [Fragaria x ananassa]